MELSKTELKILRAIIESNEATAQEVSEKTGISVSRAYALLEKLEKQKFIKKQKNSGYIATKKQEVIKLRRIFRLYSPGLIEETLDKPRLRILKSLFNRPYTVRELSSKTSLSKPRVYNYLQEFRSFGLVKNVGEEYLLATDHQIYRALRIMFTKPPGYHPELEGEGAITWAGKGEYLLHTQHPELLPDVEGIVIASPTAVSALAEYGINVFPHDVTFYVSETTTSTGERIRESGHVPVEDLILHLLLDDPYADENKRYIRWLITGNEDKIDYKYLKDKAREYDLTNEINSILYDLKPVLKRRPE
ncbi:MAG: ArsR family transcriptional regulator [Candidatus Altiarchaeota archaeon]|nr:ArsR family transcriptional regulator [Candidatus Altiarchaeota archaeon]